MDVNVIHISLKINQCKKQKLWILYYNTGLKISHKIIELTISLYLVYNYI